jgi:hypothetical protein
VSVFDLQNAMAEQRCTSAALDRAIDLAVKKLGYSKFREKQLLHL